VTTGQPKHVLIADDERDCRDSLALMLKVWGHVRIDLARNGAEALELAGPQDILILDIQMPVMTGDEVARILRANGTTAFLIALSGNRHLPDIARGAGFNAYISKPGDCEQLFGLIESAPVREVTHAR